MQVKYCSRPADAETVDARGLMWMGVWLEKVNSVVTWEVEQQVEEMESNQGMEVAPM